MLVAPSARIGAHRAAMSRLAAASTTASGATSLASSGEGHHPEPIALAEQPDEPR